jgi:hypothetical protein
MQGEFEIATSKNLTFSIKDIDGQTCLMCVDQNKAVFFDTKKFKKEASLVDSVLHFSFWPTQMREDMIDGEINEYRESQSG